LRKLRIVAAAQLSLENDEGPGSFWDLPGPTQDKVLGLLAAMIAKGVVDEDEEGRHG
jgi:hypothetical protein